jgi:hypothetical protein
VAQILVIEMNLGAPRGVHTGVAAGSTSTNTSGYLLQPGIPKCPILLVHASGGDNVAHCPTSVSIAATTNIRLETDSNFPTYKTGIGIVASMQPGPVSSVSYNQSKISEALSVNYVLQNTCPFSACAGSSTFTVGQGGSTYGVFFSSTNNIFFDQHTYASAASVLDQNHLTSCTVGCNQVYYAVSDPTGNSCGNANIAGFTIIYNFTKDTIQGTPVTRTSVTKQ